MTKSELKKKKRNRLIVSFVLVCFGLFFAWTSIEEIMLTHSLKDEIVNYEAELKALGEETQTLNKQIENLNNPDYVKRFAKGKYLVSKEGEQIFKLPSSGE
ncbi:MAG: septum formation initiator family protein [Longicatena sp.]|jgi:cell division protein DivIC|nr:septum formation initiator family protein [Longicatena sp.]